MVFQTIIGDRVFAPMHINNGKIYIGGRNHKAYCIDANTGGVLWSSFLNEKETWFSGGSISIGGTLYSGTAVDHELIAFDTKRHTKLWQAQLDDCLLSPSAIYRGYCILDLIRRRSIVLPYREK